MAKSISGSIPTPSSFSSLERTLDRTIDFLVKSEPTPEVRALLIEARRLRSVVANWRSIPPPADVHEEMLDRVNALSTAAGAPQKDWQAWDDETMVNEPEPDIPSLAHDPRLRGPAVGPAAGRPAAGGGYGGALDADFVDPEKTEGYIPSLRQKQTVLEAEEAAPESSGSMVLWTPPQPQQEVVAPPPPSLGFDSDDPKKRFKSTAMWGTRAADPGRAAPQQEPAYDVYTGQPRAHGRGDDVAARAQPANVALTPIQDAEIVTGEPTPAHGLDRRIAGNIGSVEMGKRHADGRLEVRGADGQIETRFPDGRIEARMPDGRIETRYTDGRVEVRFVDGRVETRHADGRIELRYTDGRIETRYADGAIETRFGDGRIETRFFDGRVETRYVDGRIEVRYSDGRIETRWGEPIAKGATAPAPPLTTVEAVPIRLPERIDPNIVLIADPYSDRADVFRALRRKLAAATNPKTIAVMSPGVGEGKTSAAVNLALALRETARGRVLLVEANMRSPSIARLFEFEPRECFVNQMIAHRDEPMLPWSAAEQGGSLHIIAVNPQSQRPPLLDPVAFNTAMERLKLAGYEYIVIDTPPALGNVDANLIADASDGVIMTSWALKTTKGALKKAIKQLAPAPVLGVIFVE